MALITLAEAKVLLQISGTSYDTLITTLIPIIEDDIKQFTNRDWVDSPDEPAWPVGMKLVASSMINYRIGKQLGSGLQSETVGSYSWAAEAVGGSGYPVSIEKQLQKWRYVRAVSGTVQTQYRDMREALPTWPISPEYPDA